MALEIVLIPSIRSKSQNEEKLLRLSAPLRVLIPSIRSKSQNRI